MPWNRTTRKDYKRDGRRYESDVTDKEWATLEPMIPKQGRLGGARVRQTCARSSMPSSMCWPRDASGGRCRETFRPILRS